MTVKIEFYKHATCSRCKKAEANLRRVLEERGLTFETHVEMHDSESEPDVIDYLRSINILSVPAFVACDSVLLETDPLDLNVVRVFVQKYQVECMD